MVELADALGSGPSECKLVGVQFPPSAFSNTPTETPPIFIPMETAHDSIEVLPLAVIEKIAAGEIIERPASVLKELLENSIDAGAARIDIAIEDSGFACVKVSDNGRGMSTENLKKSVLRHATSKLRTADDLYSIKTMGFRGEALASIGAVSRMTVASTRNTDGLGYGIRCEGAEIGTITPLAHARGTTVTACDLFYNIPARKKFLKTRKSERIALLRCIEQTALPFPAIHITAVFDGLPVVELPACESVTQRIAQIGGVQFAKQLIECSGSREGIGALIYVSPPDENRSKPRFQNLYVNTRKVESEQVLFAVREAFKQFTKSEYRPSFFCFLNVDPARIDVNVHPTKLKVKFEDEKALFGFIFNVARRGILSTRVEWGEVLGPRADGRTAEVTGISEEFLPALPPFHSLVREEPSGDMGLGHDNAATYEEQTVLQFPGAGLNGKKVLDPAADSKVQLEQGVQEEQWNLISCYQIHNMFILAPIKNGILLIDQHAAHERILFEQAMVNLNGGRPESQQLLFPIVIELSPFEKSVVESGIALFNSLGFEISDFGGNACSLSALPALLKDSQAQDAIRDTIRYLLDDKRDAYLSDPQRRFAAAFACGAAIKAGQKLSQEEMNALLNSLFAAENPYTCPHGRPTLVRICLFG